VVTIEVVGVNREVQSGLFESFRKEREAVGRIRVWRDDKKKELILDSGVASKRIFEWRVEDRYFPENLPGGIPRTLYVEGVSKSGHYLGDMRLLLTVTWRDRTIKSREKFIHPTVGTPASVKKHAKPNVNIANVSYRAAYDHILFTVKDEPQEKEFINNNVERVWLNVDGTPVLSR